LAQDGIFGRPIFGLCLLVIRVIQRYDVLVFEISLEVEKE
jgi:hypothetical protein